MDKKEGAFNMLQKVAEEMGRGRDDHKGQNQIHCHNAEILIFSQKINVPHTYMDK